MKKKDVIGAIRTNPETTQTQNVDIVEQRSKEVINTSKRKP